MELELEEAESQPELHHAPVPEQLFDQGRNWPRPPPPPLNPAADNIAFQLIDVDNFTGEASFSPLELWRLDMW